MGRRCRCFRCWTVYVGCLGSICVCPTSHTGGLTVTCSAQRPLVGFQDATSAALDYDAASIVTYCTALSAKGMLD